MILQELIMNYLVMNQQLTVVDHSLEHLERGVLAYVLCFLTHTFKLIKDRRDYYKSLESIRRLLILDSI